MEKEKEDFYALDGFIHIKSAKEVIYMGKLIETSRSDEALIAINTIQNQETSRAQVNCQASANGVNVALVTVTQGGQTTYWVVTNTVGGNDYNASPYPYGQIGYVDCRSLYQAAIFG